MEKVSRGMFTFSDFIELPSLRFQNSLMKMTFDPCTEQPPQPGDQALPLFSVSRPAECLPRKWRGEPVTQSAVPVSLRKAHF